MIIIPSIRKIVILVPRTGSGTLRRAIKETYPDAIQLYRHMEASGVPLGYDRFVKVGVIRNPIDRLWSLYKFLHDFDGPWNRAYIESMRNSVACSFNDWIIKNEKVFTSPYCVDDGIRYYPEYAVQNPLPENKKSQFHYLRPDLGTLIYKFDEMHFLYQDFGLNHPSTYRKHNLTDYQPMPHLSSDALEHIEKHFSWDLSFFNQLTNNR